MINSKRPVPSRMTRLYYRRVYLNSEWWITFRTGWWQRHPYAVCVVCGRKRNNSDGTPFIIINSIAHRRAVPVDLHHKTYERLWGERDDDVEPICRDCHKRHRHNK